MSDNKLKGCRVLIVEDEYFLASDLETALKLQGASIVGPIGHFDAAYRQAARDHFDVAIIDINLHNEAAYPIADELIRQSIPFVFCSGYDAKVIPERFTGVSLWQKPVDLPKLVDRIAQLCR
ncbi:response regulator [Bradyrhizobium sp. CB1650]|nr:response regulator [Bradyrhizobium sp. CB1650]WGD54887.1 response regulator [Bradyrhizobium sp. CB1650]